MKIAILFVGLIMQVNQPWSFDNTAVLPDALGHTAQLEIPYESVVAPDSWIEGNKDINNTVIIPLKGFAVRLKGTRGIFTDVTREFVDAAPPLRKIAPTCKLRDEVKSRTIKPNVLAAYFDFRGGRVSPQSYLRRMLRFNSTQQTEWSSDRCAVCRVRYDADLSGDAATLVFKQDGRIVHEVRIRGGAALVLRNQSPNPAPHSAHLYNIYRSCDQSQAVPADPGANCEKIDKCKICNPLPADRAECHKCEICVRGGSDPDPGDDCTYGQH